jgi:hypothetical protein
VTVNGADVHKPTLGFRGQVEVIKSAYNIGQKKRGGRGVPIFLWGAPGVGKSVGVVQAAKELAEQYGRKFILNPSPDLLHSPEIVNYFFVIDHRLAQELPVDAKGLVAPHYKFSGKMGWMTPVHIPPDIEGIMGILFYDELPQAPKSVQSAYFQIIHDRVAGEVPIPNGVYQMAAGNDVNSLGDYNHPSPALANRFVHYDVHCNFDEWFKWGLETNPVTGEGNIHTDILLFHKFTNGELLHRFDPTTDESMAFPSPRSWEFVSDMMDTPREFLFATIAGAVGHSAALQLNTYLSVLAELPNPLDILEKGNMHHPKDMQKQYALIGGVLSAYKNDPVHTKHFVEYLIGMSGELGTMMTKLGFKMNKGWFESSPMFLKWLSANTHLTI